MDLFNRKKIRELEAKVTALQQKQQLQPLRGGSISFPVNAGATFYPSWDTNDNIQNYINSIDVYNVVSKVAETSAAIPVYVGKEKKDKDKELKRYKALEHTSIFKSLYRIKSIEDVEQDDPLAYLLANPNKSQSGRLFMELLETYFLVNGEVFVYKMRTGESRGSKIISLHLFAAPDTGVRISGTWPFYIVGYDFSVQGRLVLQNVPPADVIHIKKPSLIQDYIGSYHRGMSPLKPAKRTVERLDTSMYRGTATLKNGGFPGIIYVEGAASEDIPSYERWKEQYRQWLDTDDNVNAYMPMAGKAGILQTVTKLADLELMGLQDYDFKKLCGIYKISHKLFDQDGTGSENSIKAMIKQLYTNACMPLTDIIADSLNKDLAPEFGPDYFIYFDFSDIPELQQDIKYQAEAIAALPVSITGNEIREWILKMDKLEDVPEMDLPLMKSGYVPITQPIELPPVDESN